MDRVLTFLLAVFLLLVASCFGSPGNRDYVKERGPERWKQVGFQVVGYQGHQWGAGGYGTPYGGAKVWWELRKVPDNGITYSGYIKRWGDDLEVYGPTARDAIAPGQ
jgi:hypothetical protein